MEVSLRFHGSVWRNPPCGICLICTPCGNLRGNWIFYDASHLGNLSSWLSYFVFSNLLIHNLHCLWFYTLHFKCSSTCTNCLTSNVHFYIFVLSFLHVVFGRIEVFESDLNPKFTSCLKLLVFSQIGKILQFTLWFIFMGWWLSSTTLTFNITHSTPNVKIYPRSGVSLNI